MGNVKWAEERSHYIFFCSLGGFSSKLRKLILTSHHPAAKLSLSTTYSKDNSALSQFLVTEQPVIATLDYFTETSFSLWRD